MAYRDVLIIIPVYREQLTRFEQISLEQCHRILHKYDTAFVAPEGLLFDYGKQYADFDVIRFSAEYFKSTASYSHLLLEEMFYERFLKYKYLLIYQLDAFVFKDELESFCQRGWDYVGAPCRGGNWDEYRVHVGNGGFSLRNVRACIKALQGKEALLDTVENCEIFDQAEDLFFSYYGRKNKEDFKIPDRHEAERFAIGLNCWNVFNRVSKELPFGCHGWYRWEYDFWRPYILRYGVDLPPVAAEFRYTVEWMRWQAIRNFLLDRIIRYGLGDDGIQFVREYIPVDHVSVYGNGHEGRRCRIILQMAGIAVDFVFDRKFKEKFQTGGLTFCPIEDISPRTGIILIASSNFEDTIARNLDLREVSGYVLFSEMADRIIFSRYGVKQSHENATHREESNCTDNLSYKEGVIVLRIVVFGTGTVGRTLLSMPLKSNCEIVMVCDNDISSHGKYCHGYLIESPVKINTIEYDVIILATDKYARNINNQLLDMGVDSKKIQFPDGWNTMEYMVSPLEKYFDVKKKPIVPFQKNPAKIYQKYEGETYRAFARRRREGFFEKYCQGEGLDIGYGSDPLTPDCSGWDLQNGDAQYLNGIEDECFDWVYSSHCLEHMVDVRVALKNWWRTVRKGGYLIIAVPHRDLYEKKKALPSRWNGDHKHMFLIGKREAPDTLDIVEEIRMSLENYDIKYVKTCDEGHTITDPLIHSDGEYQIEMVIQKLLTES